RSSQMEAGRKGDLLSQVSREDAHGRRGQGRIDVFGRSAEGALPDADQADRLRYPVRRFPGRVPASHQHARRRGNDDVAHGRTELDRGAEEVDGTHSELHLVVKILELWQWLVHETLFRGDRGTVPASRMSPFFFSRLSGGGGGSRTRVRKGSAWGFYTLS